MAIPLLNAAGMRELDRITIEDIGVPGPVLMEIAGRGCAEAAEELLETVAKDSAAGGAGRIAVVCGKGNNGGDGLVAARHLHNAGHLVDVYLLAEPDTLRGDAALNHGILDRMGLAMRVLADEDAADSLDLTGYDVILDAVLGTGLANDVRGRMAVAIQRMNAAPVPVVAVDIPSGISADTGAPLGVAIQAQVTVTFGYAKPGHVVVPGAGYTGELVVVDIGIPPDLDSGQEEHSWLLTEDDLIPYLQRRDPAAHKGHFGHLLVAAGSPDKPGAAGLCCRAAVRAGAGLVTLAGSEATVQRVVAGPVEYMGVTVETPDDLLAACVGKSALALGPGLGTSRWASELVRAAVAEVEIPVVVDADGLNNLAGALHLVEQAPAPRILTPHPGEMARLLQMSTAEIQRDRLAAARKLAREQGCVVVLKGAGTVVAEPDGTAYVVPVGNPGMASGGTGDVLTGVIGSLLAQKLTATEAATVGAFLHGLAGDFVAIEKGEHALAASDLIEALAPVIRTFEAWYDEDDEADEAEPDFLLAR